jgi:hypothetical protein
MTNSKPNVLIRDIRLKFVDAVLSIHGIYNYRYSKETFGVTQASVSRDMTLLHEEMPGILYNHHTKSFETTADYKPMPTLEAVKFLRAISTVFDSTDFSVPGSVTVSQSGGKE